MVPPGPPGPPPTRTPVELDVNETVHVTLVAPPSKVVGLTSNPLIPFAAVNACDELTATGVVSDVVQMLTPARSEPTAGFVTPWIRNSIWSPGLDSLLMPN